MYFRNNECKSFIAEASLSTFTQISSMINVVPAFRIPAWHGSIPFLSVHNLFLSWLFWVNANGKIRSSTETIVLTISIHLSTWDLSSDWNSHNKAAPSGGIIFFLYGNSGDVWSTWNAEWSIISQASIPISFNCGIRVQAFVSSLKSRSPVALNFGLGIVCNVTSEINPSVPSEPTMRWVSISTGLSKSRNEFSE